MRGKHDCKRQGRRWTVCQSENAGMEVRALHDHHRGLLSLTGFFNLILRRKHRSFALVLNVRLRSENICWWIRPDPAIAQACIVASMRWRYSSQKITFKRTICCVFLFSYIHSFFLSVFLQSSTMYLLKSFSANLTVASDYRSNNIPSHVFSCFNDEFLVLLIRLLITIASP